MISITVDYNFIHKFMLIKTDATIIYIFNNKSLHNGAKDRVTQALNTFVFFHDV